MEQTLGKRIAQHRKRIGLTQEALAEKLGITAQAVSKWENDLSCPDIATLPQLADIFGITTDELLGKASNTKVYEAEVVNDDDSDGGLFNVRFNSGEEDGKWEFHWDSGRTHAVFFAIWVLLVGITYLLVKWFSWDVSFWSILWPSFMLMYGLKGIFPKFSVFHLGVALFGGYYLLSNLGLWHLVIAEKLVFPICVVLFGLGLLVDALRKPKKPKFRVVKHGSNQKTHCDCRILGDRFACDLSFGQNTHKVDLPLLSGGEANCSFGELVVDLTGCETVSENCMIEANSSFAEILFRVPRRFQVLTENSTAFASVTFSGQPDNTPVGIIRLEANASFGQITVRYI